MAILYLGPVPRPEGADRVQFYAWSKKLAKWFERWYSAANSTGSFTSVAMGLHSWSAKATITGETTNAQYFVLRVYKDQTAYNSTGRIPWLCIVGDGNTSYGNLFSIQNGIKVYENDPTGPSEVLFIAGANHVLSAAIVYVGFLSKPMYFLGPSGLFVSTRVNLA